MLRLTKRYQISKWGEEILNIHEAILHRIEKDKNTSGAGSAKMVMRSECLPIDTKLERTAADILRIYTKIY